MFLTACPYSGMDFVPISNRSLCPVILKNRFLLINLYFKLYFVLSTLSPRLPQL